jgi:hypothetical protein
MLHGTSSPHCCALRPRRAKHPKHIVYCGLVLVMVDEVEWATRGGDMAVQLARVREMEKNGEWEPIPEVSATTH